MIERLLNPLGGRRVAGRGAGTALRSPGRREGAERRDAAGRVLKVGRDADADIAGANRWQRRFGVDIVDGIGATEWPARIDAFVVPAAGAAVADAGLAAFVNDKRAPGKCPRQVAFVRERPNTATDQVQRSTLREPETPRP